MERDAMPGEGFVLVDGEAAYRIPDPDRMPPFLMSVTSDSDLWMFLGSRGGLTAGRVDPDGSLFPYETVDRLHDAHLHTGPVTVLRVRRPGAQVVRWVPFAAGPSGDALDAPPAGRSLAKTILGNRVVFEEVRDDLGLTFRARWAGCDAFGWVRTATLTHRGEAPVSVDILDGLRNVLPYGAPLAMYQQSSSLVDAYKRTDVDPDTGLACVSLTARIVDRAEAAEELRANVVWSHGLDAPVVALSLDALAAFARGDAVAPERVLTGRRANYLVSATRTLAPGESVTWHVVADVGRDHVHVEALRQRLRAGGDLHGEIEAGLAGAAANLRRLVASADGLQRTADGAASAHHAANVLFNDMRGGIFARNHEVPRDDFADFVATRNREVARRHAEFLASRPDPVDAGELRRAAASTGDPDLERLALEYLPLHFGRRHGDPSRPWNRFRIRVRNADGSRALRYEGNWRDIFQNWEALAISFPRFLPHFVAKFVDASTVDGFNPYRIGRDGVDWEVEDPDDPWSTIGYWGDHQIVYLLKFLEAWPRHEPGALAQWLDRALFTYADVPYRLKPYDAIRRDPHRTIDFDAERAARIADRVAALGTDGRLVPAADGSPLRVTLLEKLLVPALSKLSCLVPDGGIWMNTQRPEWNDANNALVGHGVSMVTLAYLRRYLRHLERVAADAGLESAMVSAEVVAWMRRVREILAEDAARESASLSDAERGATLDALGAAFETYRTAAYDRGLSSPVPLPLGEVTALCRDAGRGLDRAIAANRRDDGLAHSYGLLERRDGGGAAVRPLHLMLEGQVAALSSGAVGAAEAVKMLDALSASDLYRADQQSFLLYPVRERPAFLDRNVVPDERIAAVPLLGELLAAGETSLLARDAAGVGRFHGDFHNAADVAAALDRLGASARWAEAVRRDRDAVLDVFEAVFRHRSFTGRSGTMYGYEGIGCIYWHMVAKLLLAVQEIAVAAAEGGEAERETAHRDETGRGGSADLVGALARAYYRIRAGLGFEKTAAAWGAFPPDPYSHTPGHAGAQQPGMTGQVKEEILTRFGELGVRIDGGTVRFRPTLLRASELLATPERFEILDVAGEAYVLDLPAGSLAFTLAQVPIVYLRTSGPGRIRVHGADGQAVERPGDGLDARESASLFDRDGGIRRIDVEIPEDRLLRL